MNQQQKLIQNQIYLPSTQPVLDQYNVMMIKVQEEVLFFKNLPNKDIDQENLELDPLIPNKIQPETEEQLEQNLRRLIGAYFSKKTLNYTMQIQTKQFIQKDQQINQGNMQTTNIMICERYLPDLQILFIQAFELNVKLLIYEVSIPLEQLKQNDKVYDDLLAELIHKILKNVNNAEIYFLEFGRVLRTYCLVGSDQIKVFQKCIQLLLQLSHSWRQVTFVMGSFDFQDQLQQQELQQLVSSAKIIRPINFLFNNIEKTIFKIHNGTIMEDGNDQIISNVDKVFQSLLLIQNEYIQIENEIKLILKPQGIRLIINQYFDNPESKICNAVLTQIIINFINSLNHQQKLQVNNIFAGQQLIQFIIKLIKKILKLKGQVVKRLLLKPKPIIKVGEKIPPLIEVRQISMIDFACFDEPCNRHFPEKRQNCVKCKVCRRNSALSELSKIHKTKYRCKGCFLKFKRNINLCITPCFEEFHLHPDSYLIRNKNCRPKDKLFKVRAKNLKKAISGKNEI